MSSTHAEEQFENKDITESSDKEKEHDSIENINDGNVLSPNSSSMSPQTTLKYIDTEECKAHDKSHESSSDSIETLEDLPSEDSHVEISQTYLQGLSLIENTNSDMTDEAKENVNVSSVSDGDTSTDSHEVLLDSSTAPRPESLSITSPLRKEKVTDSDKSNNSKDDEAVVDDSSSKSDKGQCGDCSTSKKTRTDSVSSQGLPQGTITRQGHMIQFVADDLTQKIKLSSPKSHTDSDSLGSRRSSVKSIVSVSSSTSATTSSGKSRSPSSQWQQSPDDIPPIDVAAVAELEARARRVADSVDLMMGNIRNNLHKMSAITIGCQEAYKRSVDITCDSVDGSIKAMYAMMAKCEELSTAMKPVDQLATQIKEIKRILELFEAQLSDK